MRVVAGHARKVNVLLAVEALNRFERYLVNCMADISRFVAEVNHPSCKLMYDTSMLINRKAGYLPAVCLQIPAWFEHCGMFRCLCDYMSFLGWQLGCESKYGQVICLGCSACPNKLIGPAPD